MIVLRFKMEKQAPSGSGRQLNIDSYFCQNKLYTRFASYKCIMNLLLSFSTDRLEHVSLSLFLLTCQQQ